MTTEAEIRAMLPQAKAHLGPPGTGRTRRLEHNQDKDAVPPFPGGPSPLSPLSIASDLQSPTYKRGVPFVAQQ